ncbi:FkbM family methyltransferase [Bradyrhizobium japonicum]|uniref:FkbM family methyltransferase n=1 Tax=Bradyrhizobium japonicum TaxID=375 RepID=UPI001BA6DF57|nr:FkbM family methyltransferase [Bradyrhizobium japonicum]MBR0960142.1 FkbM family methyltransferase [Bradyrhizobium japonicum]
MNLKAVARYFYANVPGVAATRFAVKDSVAPYLFKREFLGVRLLKIGSGLIVDVGANRGQSTAAFKKLAPSSHIVAVEPEPRSAKRLAFRHRRDDAVTVLDCALGCSSGVIDFFLPRYGRWECDGMAATSYEEATEWLKNPGRMYRFDAKKLTVREHRVTCKALDSLDLAPALIKLHAQGAELDILKGALGTLQQQRPALMCAFASPAVTEFLSDLGYRPYVYDRGCFRSGTAPLSVTFTWYLTEAHVKASNRARRRMSAFWKTVRRRWYPI